MEAIETQVGDNLVIILKGRLDASTAGPVESQLLARIEAGERKVVVDLAEMDYISSAGLRVFLLALKRLTAGGGAIVLCSLQEPVRQIFDIAGFSGLFSIFPSRDEALASLS
jgi:anti-anti-sigma factor